jgi:hypothetical protein
VSQLEQAAPGYDLNRQAAFKIFLLTGADAALNFLLEIPQGKCFGGAQLFNE